LGKKQQNSADLLEDHVSNTNTEELPKGDGSLHTSENSGQTIPGRASENSAPFDVEDAKESSEKQSVADSLQDSGEFVGENNFSSDNSTDMKPRVEQAHVREEQLPTDDVHTKEEDFPRSSTTMDSTADENLNSKKLEGSSVGKGVSQEATSERHEGDEKLPMFSEANTVIQGNMMNKDHSVGSKSEVSKVQFHILIWACSYFGSIFWGKPS